MGHVLFAAPSIERFHLHERLARALQRRGHRVTVLATDPVTRRCYGLHGLPAQVLVPERPAAEPPLELTAFAARDLRLAGVRQPDLRALRARRHRLGRLLAAASRCLEVDLPDLVWFHESRDGFARMLHALARHYGIATVHTGTGALPGSMQRDADGVDGDASAATRCAADYRDVKPDRQLLDGALATALGGPAGVPPRRPLLGPDGVDAIATFLEGVRRRTLSRTLERMRAWRTSAGPTPLRRPDAFGFPPKPPFVAVLLQSKNDPRLVLDVDGELPSTDELLRLCGEGARMHDPELCVHPVPPHAPAAGRAAAVATAAAVVTINDPLGFLGVLAGTPVVHLGNTFYGVPGVARRAIAANLVDELALALGADQPTLRRRLATRALREDHVWCDPDAPDQNGIAGLVSDFEARLLAAIAPPPPLVYRPDPPLG